MKKVVSYSNFEPKCRFQILSLYGDYFFARKICMMYYIIQK